jgi:membrane protein YdbS with pleckstrin-like domain
MFCDKCGAENKDTAVFCRKCGGQIGEPAVASDVEQETRVAARPSGPGDAGPATRAEEADGAVEAEIFSISPTLMFVKAGYVAAALGAILLVAITSAFTSLSALWAIVVGLMLFLIPAYYHIRQKLIRYTLTESKLEIDAGFISRTTRNVPIRRIQDVTISSNVWQRLLGFGDVVIDNASEESGKVVLKNINTPSHYADVLLKQMRRLEG